MELYYAAHTPSLLIAPVVWLTISSSTVIGA
jgi:hypothetical protein